MTTQETVKWAVVDLTEKLLAHYEGYVEVLEENERLRELVWRSLTLAPFALDVPKREAEAQQYINEAHESLREEE